MDTEKDLLFETIDKKMIHFINNYIEMASNIELNVNFLSRKTEIDYWSVFYKKILCFNYNFYFFLFFFTV